MAMLRVWGGNRNSHQKDEESTSEIYRRVKYIAISSQNNDVVGISKQRRCWYGTISSGKKFN